MILILCVFLSSNERRREKEGKICVSCGRVYSDERGWGESCIHSTLLIDVNSGAALREFSTGDR